MNELFKEFYDIASNPEAQFKKYKDAGKNVVLCAPVYTPEEIIHSMGAVPFGAWGADIALNESKKYFPAFICSIMQSILELGMKGAYMGAKAIVIPSLCDSLKVLGENWKYAVKDIPFIPMTYPQNRKPEFGREYTKAGYERVIVDLEKALGAKFDDAKLVESIKIHNEHNAVMREFSKAVAKCEGISAKDRQVVFKSAWFMEKSEHTAMVKDLIIKINGCDCKQGAKVRIVTSGILADAPELLNIFDEFGYHIVADDIAAESRQYKTDTKVNGNALDALTNKFAEMDNCSVLYDPEKKRVNMIADLAKANDAKGVVVVLTKFCDPEEFDYPLIKKACDKAGIACALIEVDRQMENYEQARTILETFKDVIA
ncbi:MAG: 2-hydroxyacyl-CoA dehydratase family protein [Parasporobacterium sp.]|nr:2-hydroxyacyl-CoA dehydratase family protein [Parasporobacterium sp.]